MAFKLVRGAYKKEEDELSEAKNEESPVFTVK